MKNNRPFIVAAAVLVVAGLAGYVALTGIYPPKAGTEGAIGAATRYQAPQITDTDVALQDATVQAFLQSDVFHELSINPTFRKAVSNPSTITQLKELYSKSKIEDGAKVSELMKNSKELNRVANDELFKKAVQQKDVAELARQWVLTQQKSGDNKAASAELLGKIKDVFKKGGVSELDAKSTLLQSKAFVDMMAKGQATELLNNRDVLSLLSDASLGELFADGDLAETLMSKNVADAMKIAPAEVLAKATAERRATSQPAKATSQP